MSELKVGTGFDVHRFSAGKPLVLGGVEIPFPQGLAGHSDADVLTHSVCDALLGAAGLGDIGHHFPDTDDQYKGISSLLLLGKVIEKTRREGLRPVNVDVTLISEQPRIAPYIEEMKRNLQEKLGTASQINIKATTTEGLGWIGRGEGIACMAVCLMEKLNP